MSENKLENKVEVEEIKPETLKDLLGKATPTEWKYMLILEKWDRQGGAYTDYADFEILLGKADIIEIEEWDSGYPYTAGEKCLVVPKTVPVVILWYSGQDYGDGLKRKREIYVFTRDGWKRVEV
jgi:hypothetical protein